MAVLNVNGGSVAVVEIFEQWTAPASQAIQPGRAVYRHATTGWAQVCGSANPASGIALNETNYAGQALTVMRRGILELGDAAIQGINYEAPIYVHGDLGGTATGTMADAPTAGGTWVVGSVAALHGGHTGLSGGTVTARRVLRVNL